MWASRVDFGFGGISGFFGVEALRDMGACVLLDFYFCILCIYFTVIL